MGVLPGINIKEVTEKLDRTANQMDRMVELLEELVDIQRRTEARDIEDREQAARAREDTDRIFQHEVAKLAAIKNGHAVAGFGDNGATEPH